MNSYFADTSYYVALLNSSDEYHLETSRWTSEFDGRIITTAWVLTELANHMAQGPNRRVVTEFVNDLQSDSRVLIAPATEELYDAGWALYARRQDKEWSLTDCISFVVMSRHKLAEALTADHHFEQAGFQVLLK